MMQVQICGFLLTHKIEKAFSFMGTWPHGPPPCSLWTICLLFVSDSDQHIDAVVI